MSGQTHAPTGEVSPEALFALQYVDSMGSPDAAPGPVDPSAVGDVLGLTREIRDVHEQLLVLDGLNRLAHDSGPLRDAIERAEDLMYGRGLIEVASLDELPRAAKRILQGKNPALVVRKDIWGEETADVGDGIVDLLAGEVGQFDKVGVEEFPKPSMPTGSSALHLDNFIRTKPEAGGAGFRYAFSAAKLREGKVMFVGGIASRRARDAGPKIEGRSHPYDEAQIKLEQSRPVQGLYDSAMSGRPRGKSEVDVDGTHLVSVVLGPGDVVMWPQGGPGSEAPAWHGFRKIGDLPRASTSYHYVQRPPEQA